jgi:hypothetical protein
LPVSLKDAKTKWTESSMKNGGLLLEKIEAFPPSDSSEKILYYVSQVQSGLAYKKIIMLTEYKHNTLALITAGAPEEVFESLCENLKISLLSIVYNPASEVSNEQKLWFSINTSCIPELALNNVMAGITAGYSWQGKTSKETGNKTIYLIAKSTGPVGLADKKQYALRVFKSMPQYTNYNIQTSSEAIIDGMEGFEMTGTANHVDDNAEVVIYSAIVFSNDNHYHRFVGIAPISETERLANFKTITESFFRK